MGGMNSGRWDQGGKDTTDDYRALDVRRWQRDGLLTPGHFFGWNWTRNGEKMASIQVRTEADRVTLIYRHRSGGGELKDEQYPVLMVWTPCHYGGKRTWFLCPAAGCGRRVAILYGGGIFACRHCTRLAYRCQRENLDDRATRRADKIRDRLAWEPGILNGHGSKPRGMHWRTYQRLIVKHDALVDVSVGWMQRRMRMIDATLGSIGEDLNLFRKIEG